MALHEQGFSLLVLQIGLTGLGSPPLSCTKGDKFRDDSKELVWYNDNVFPEGAGDKEEKKREKGKKKSQEYSKINKAQPSQVLLTPKVKLFFTL